MWLTGLYLLSTICSVSAADYLISGNPETDTVFFASTAKLEFIEGKNHDISGYFAFPPEAAGDSVIGVLKVDLRTLKTGIETRDEHMRDRHLHTDDYPFAYFELRNIIDMPSTIDHGVDYSVRGDGYFYIHGNKRKLNADISFILLDTNRLNVIAEFSLNLDEYKIPRPKALFLKLAETINVKVIFQARKGADYEEVNLPDYKLLQ